MPAEGRGPAFREAPEERTAAKAQAWESDMGLTPPPKVEKLQKVLRAKAKEEPEARFHQLYDKIWRKDVLAHAYERCLKNGGAAGVDGQTFEAIESQGRE